MGGVAPQIWYFSTRDEKLAEKLSAAVGEQIRLHYTEHRGVPTALLRRDAVFRRELYAVVKRAQ